MITLTNLKIQYDRLLLQDTNLTFYPGQVSLISGKSGIGKTSLLYRIGLASNRFDYEMAIDDIKIHTLNEKKINDIRRYRIGFVLQEKDLLEHLDVFGNLSYYALMVGKSLKQQEAKELLHQVSLYVPFTQDIMTLSLGERQRLAIACSLVKNPDIILMDEPTASLDQHNEELILQILKDLAHKQNKYVIIASHSQRAMDIADWIYTFHNCHIEITKQGELNEFKTPNKQPQEVSFVKPYMKQYLHKYRYLQIMMICIIALTFLISYFLYTFFQQNINKEKELLYQQFDKQLYIVDRKENIYIDEGIHPFKLEDTSAKPYIKAVLNDYPEIEVIPYFDSNNFSDKVSVSFYTTATHGVYVSKEAEELLGNQVSIYKDGFTFFINLYEFSSEGIQNHILSQQLPVNGILKKGVKNHYTKPGHAYIYIYEPILTNFYSSVAHSDQYAGYTCLYENIEELKQAKIDFENKGYFVNDKFIELESVEAIIQHTNDIQNKSLAVLYIISFILMNAICIYLFYQRRKEMALLKLNGIRSKELHNIFMKEYSLEAFIAILIGYLISIGIFLLFHIFHIKMIFINTLFILLALLFISIIYILLIHHLTVENELRG